MWTCVRKEGKERLLRTMVLGFQANEEGKRPMSSSNSIGDRSKGSGRNALLRNRGKSKGGSRRLGGMRRKLKGTSRLAEKGEKKKSSTQKRRGEERKNWKRRLLSRGKKKGR